jgi:hypothetical protein
MKKSILKDTHRGSQPIRVLQHNITARLEQRNEHYIKVLQNDFRLNKGIVYVANELSLDEKQRPFIDENGTIHIHETFISYIWLISYYFFVIHEEGCAIPDLIKRNLPVRNPQNLLLLNEAEEVFNYAKLIIRVFEKWDKDILPNPEFFDEDSEEGWYILRTNDIFVETLNFILFHEIAHAELQHIKKIKQNNLSDEDRKKLELEADTRAIQLIFSNCRNRVASEISIVVGIASMLFSKANLDGGRKHPNINERIENFLILSNPTEDSSVWTMLTLFFKVWDKQFNLGLSERESYETYKELYYDLLNQVK